MRHLIIGGIVLMSLGAASGNMLLNWSRLQGLAMPDEYRVRRVSRLTDVGPGATVTLCDIKSPGCINHIWMTLGNNDYRNIILRMYWDDEEDPSVEAPITELFGIGHNMKFAQYSTPLLAVSPNNGLNIYFPMPFSSRARITLTNDNIASVKGGVYFQADYSEFAELPDCPLRFHAQWRRDNPAIRRGKFYTIAEAVGEGYFLGATFHVRLRDRADSWYHGGGDEILIDGGSANADVLHGIGGEDFFGASWGIKEFQSPYCGCITSGERISMYRFLIENPIRFGENIRVSFGAMANDISSVGYWYQTEPHQRFFRLPPPEERLPQSDIAAERYDIALLPEVQGTWAMLGPLAGNIDRKYAPEERLERDELIDLSAAYQTDYQRPYKDVLEGDDRPLRWERVRTDLWWLDLNAAFMPKMAGPRCVQTVHGVAYLLAHVQSPRDWRACLRATFDDELKVWLDEHLVFEGAHKDNYATEMIPIEMRRGGNTILVKTSNATNENWGAWCLSLRFCQTDGAPAPDVTYDPLEEASESFLLLRSEPGGE